MAVHKAHYKGEGIQCSLLPAGEEKRRRTCNS